MNQLVNPPISFGPSGASPNGGFQNYSPPVIQSDVVPVNGALQVETATAAGTISGAGNIQVTITSALFDEPLVVPVAVANADTATVVGGKIRSALQGIKQVTDVYTIGGSTTAVVLTAKTSAPNDTSLNIALATGTATGLTPAPNSANTTAGVEGTKAVIGQEVILPNGTFMKMNRVNPPTWVTLSTV